MIFSKGDDGKDFFTGVKFDKYHAKEAEDFDKAINGPNSGFKGLWTEAK